MRSKLIDWVFHCCKVTVAQDTNVFFSAVRFIDIYYARVGTQKVKSDLQLTAIAALLMSSKLLEMNALKLKFCIKSLGHNKFSKESILGKEIEIMKLCNW